MANMKMTATASKKGFTLVELIVVITILAILGTIGFISLQGYSAQSRDSKRTSDLRSLATAVTTKNTEGLGLLSMVTQVSTSLVTTGRTIAGNAAAAVISTAWATQVYTAGDPNTTVLGINAGNFNDPSASVPYKIGATTLVGGSFQLAATLENDGTKTALVTGNYNNRGNTGTSTFSVTGATSQKVVTLPTSAVGFFKKGDLVVATGVTSWTAINSVSADGVTVTLSADVTGLNPTLFRLVSPEQWGLIGTSTGVAVTNNQAIYLPY